ncbi:unnamed protein product [Phaedon cochleariae]|uniref:FLYWCH-type domain-containing protein n=1 Tax=Phaedon cochleariae TaxID=80249 RepID=A0A9N9SAW4_PHACE|nr:unnamed protein product [Phaedon cochleariae]
MESLQITNTTKGKPSAIFKGFQYRKHRVNKDEVVSWLCVKQKSERCNGNLKTKNGVVLSTTDHCCKTNPVDLEVKLKINNAKKRARESEEPISKIYKEEVEPLLSQGLDFVVKVPVFSSVKSSLYSARYKEQGKSSEPETAAEIQLPEDIFTIPNGTFLLADDGAEERMIVLSTTFGRQLLSSKRSFFMDGTFKSCSRHGGRFTSTGERIRLPDDVTMGYIIEHLLKQPLTVVDQFHSHLEPMKFIRRDMIEDQISFSYAKTKDEWNVVKIEGFEESEDQYSIQQERNKILRRHLKETKEKSDDRCYIRGEKLYINNRAYTVEDILELEEKEGIVHNKRANSEPPTTPTVQNNHPSAQTEKSGDLH